jgi:anti-anti-sigma factor
MLGEGNPIHMDVRFPVHQVSIIDLSAELGILAEDALWQAYRQATDKDTRWVLLNFTDTKYIDSAGIGLITLLLIQAEKDSLEFGAFGLTKHYRNIFVITQLDQVIKIFETEAEALTKINEPGISHIQETSVTDESPNQLDLTLDEIVDPSLENFPWAKPVDRLKVEGFPKEALSLNVEGRKLTGPFQGFGQLWHKTYRIRLENQQLTPAETIQIWKQNLPKFKPAEKRFYPSPAGIRPGEIILINARTQGGPISTGVMVLYSGKNSFTLITPQGHPEAGWVTFSAYKDDHETVLQVDVLARSSDPLYELDFRLVGTRAQDRIWTHVLTSLAEHLNTRGEMQVFRRLVDADLQWKNAANIRYNAQIRTILHILFTPFRWVITGTKNFFQSIQQLLTR